MAHTRRKSTILGAAPLWVSRVRVLSFSVSIISDSSCPPLGRPKYPPGSTPFRVRCNVPSTPRPIFRVHNQPSLYGVCVHIFQLFLEFILGPNIKVVKSPLPEVVFSRLRFGGGDAPLFFSAACGTLPALAPATQLKDCSRVVRSLTGERVPALPQIRIGGRRSGAVAPLPPSWSRIASQNRSLAGQVRFPRASV